MGYYTGNGVVTSGGKSLRDLGYSSAAKGNVWQRTTVTNTTQSGVSLATAQALAPTNTVGNFTWTSTPAGSDHIYRYSCVGERKSTQYTRVGDSSLYILTSQLEKLEVMLVNTGTVRFTPTGWQSTSNW